MEEVEIRPAQRFTRTRQKTGEEEPVIGLPVTFQSGPGDASQCHQAKGAGQGQPPAAGEAEVSKQGKIELLTTQEQDREAQQTTDQVCGSQEAEREGRTQIMGLSRGTRRGSLITSKQTTN